MARSQTWTRNVGNKPKKSGASGTARGIVGGDALEDLKRKAEGLGLIIHARPRAKDKGLKKRGGK